MMSVQQNRFAIIVAVIWLLCLPSDIFAGSLQTGHQYRLFFPEIPFSASDGERIEKIEVSMSCGQFRGVAVIPSDWSLKVVSPVSMKTKLIADAGHGSTALWDLHELKGSISILVEELSCFDITVVILSEIDERTQRHEFSRTKLILKP